MLSTYEFKLRNGAIEIVNIIKILQDNYLNALSKIQNKENSSTSISRDEVVLAAEFVSESALQIISIEWVNELSEAIAMLSNQEAIDLFIVLNKEISICDTKKLSNNQKKFLLKDEIKKMAQSLFSDHFFDEAMRLSGKAGLAIRTVLNELRVAR